MGEGATIQKGRRAGELWGRGGPERGSGVQVMLPRASQRVSASEISKVSSGLGVL